MPNQPELSAAEWMVVSLAFKDAADCGCAIPPEPGSVRDRIGRLRRALFGGERTKTLADARLEALRRFVCTTRVTRRPAEQYAGDLATQGFSRAQIDALALLSA